MKNSKIQFKTRNVVFFAFLLALLTFQWSAANASGGFVDSENSSGEGQATFSLVPSTGTHRSGEEFALDLRLNTQDVITSVRAYLSFDPKVLNVVRIEKGNTLSYWWESAAEDGVIKLSASVPAPGISGQIAIATIIFKGQQAGGSNIGYDPNSVVLNAADQDVVNLASSAEGNFVVVPGAESDSETEAGAKGSSGNFLGILFGIAGVLLVGVVLYIVWRKTQRGGE